MALYLHCIYDDFPYFYTISKFVMIVKKFVKEYLIADVSWGVEDLELWGGKHFLSIVHLFGEKDIKHIRIHGKLRVLPD